MGSGRVYRTEVAGAFARRNMRASLRSQARTGLLTEQGKRILVVDDNEMNTDLLKRRLERRGFLVVVAHTGKEALLILDEQPIDMVLLDVMMPEMNGVEVLQAIRVTRSPTTLPVIMATAKADNVDIIEALDKGANDYVTKPIDLEVLLARMRVHLRHSVRPARSSVPPRQIGAGVVIDQKYRLTAILGQGGFGTVYRALHVQLNKEVAVKVLHPDYLQSPEVVQRFKQEGISACRVRHPNAVAVMDAGTTTSGVPYLVMELLEGHSLADELMEKGAMRLRRCVELIDPVCNALREAHNSGIVHRDIKPANIMLSRGPTGEQVVKVLDFGIAKFMESQPASANTSNQAAGTPRYMAPERLLGEPSDAKADVYSVGVTVFEMLSGTLPFPKVEGNPLQQAVKQLQAVPTVLLTVRPDLPHDLVRVVMGALARDRNDRPDLDSLQTTLDDWSTRWAEPAWPVPALDHYVEGQMQAPVPETQANAGPTRVFDTGRALEAGSDLESGDRPTQQSDEIDPELAKSRG
jgi:serine/threonine protein kinase